MFKKSLLEGNQTEPPVVGKFIFHGYEEVRTTPQNQPPFLKQRLRMGKDVIAIWFQHVHAERFKALDELQDIKLTSKAVRAEKFLPTADEMTPQEILDFCKSIDVHPAHLVPFDSDPSLSLPTPLLELLIEMAYDGKASQGLEMNEVYLARNAIANECKRAKRYLEGEKKDALQNNGHFSTLSGVFAEILSDMNAVQSMAKTTVVTPTNSFAAEASRSYPYIDRVHDLAIIQAEAAIEQSNQRMESKREILQLRIEGFFKAYQKVVNPNVIRNVEAADFLMDVMDEFDGQVVPALRVPPLREVEDAVKKLLAQHRPFQHIYQVANNFFSAMFGDQSDKYSQEDEQSLRHLDENDFYELVTAIQIVFDGQYRLIASEKEHEELEGQYIRKSGQIGEAFDKIGEGYKRNILNNRILLALHKINATEPAMPQAIPK